MGLVENRSIHFLLIPYIPKIPVQTIIFDTMSENITPVTDSDLINRLISTRRSIFPKQFEAGKVIPDNIIWQALENANWAPSHKLTEPWRFTVFAGEGLQ